MTSELEITMIFFFYFVLKPLITKYQNLNTLIPETVFATVRSPCILTVDFQPHYLELKPKFEVLNGKLNCLLFTIRF